jgi:hypothetical protein
MHLFTLLSVLFPFVHIARPLPEARSRRSKTRVIVVVVQGAPLTSVARGVRG